MIPTELRQRVEADVVIFGGGIAGLWTLGRLRSLGYSVLLLENRALGGVQTLASQGIIHGGTKYTLAGKLTESARAIGAMPSLWRAALAGEGELDLRRVRLLSDHQFLCSTADLVSRLAGFFADKAMQSRIRPVQEDERPGLLRDPKFEGAVYRLEEPVLDVCSLIAELVRQFGDCTHRITFPQGVELKSGAEQKVIVTGEGGAGLEITTHRIVFAAGSGNQALLKRLGREQPAMQRRPLHMVMLRSPSLPPLYVHYLGASINPRLTITTHGDERQRVWYLGGELAESGVRRTAGEQIAAARQVLLEVIPWLDLNGTEWSTLRLDRAEPAQLGGRRPDDSFFDEHDGVIVGWPTKLALAPRLAQMIINSLERAGITPALAQPDPVWQRPAVTNPPWECAQWS